MSWALVASAKSGNADGNGGPFVAPNTGTVNTTGADLYVVALSCYGTGAVPTVGNLVDVGLNGYTALTQQGAAGDANNIVSVFYKVAPVTSAVEKWTANDGQYVGLCAAAFSGCAASPTITSTRSGTTSSTPSAGSLGSAGDLVVAAVADYDETVSSIDSSFAIIQQSNYTAANNIGIALAWQNLIGGIAGAVNPTWTMSGTPDAVAVMAASFTGTGGGGGIAIPVITRQFRERWN